jgi:hypothetical protein
MAVAASQPAEAWRAREVEALGGRIHGGRRLRKKLRSIDKSEYRRRYQRHTYDTDGNKCARASNHEEDYIREIDLKIKPQ